MMTQTQVQQTADALITFQKALKTVKRNKVSGTINGNSYGAIVGPCRKALMAAGWNNVEAWKMTDELKAKVA